MTNDAKKTRPCPSCGKPALREGPTAPFCSKQCKMADLGAWFLEEYRLPVRNPTPEDVEEAVEAAAREQGKDVH